VALVLVLSTGQTAALAVRLRQVLPAVEQLRSSSIVIASSMLIFSFAQGPGAVPAVAVLLLAVTVYSVGDVLAGNASAGLSYALSDPACLGHYQGVNTLGLGIAQTVAPVALTSLLLTGRTAWWIFAGFLLTTGLALPPLARKAEESRLRRCTGTVAPTTTTTTTTTTTREDA